MNRTAYFTIVYRPFLPWKHTERTLRIARERGFEIVVAWDDRNSRSDYERIRTLADTVVPFTSHGMTEYGYKVSRHIKSEFALILADDEEPADPLWDIAANPPSASRFGIPVIPVLGDRYMKGHIGMQERLSWMEDWELVPRVRHDGIETMFEGRFQSPAPMVEMLTDKLPYNAGLLIWHYLLEAPRAEREAKAERYAKYDIFGDHATRLFWEEQPESLIDIPVEMRQYLPKGELHGKRQICVEGHATPAPASR